MSLHAGQVDIYGCLAYSVCIFGLRGVFSQTNKFDGNAFQIHTIKNVASVFTPPGFWLNIQNDQFFAQHNLSMRSFILSVSKNFLGQDETEPSTNQTYGHEEELEDFANDVPLSVSYSYDPVTQFLNYIDNGNFSVNGVLADVPLILHQRL
ncbi:hypothetical protein CMV_026497 [Castanea mollissima]|uniref:glycerophosphodiester phosphodiesterase n=1 Tax=Castanea mollissima TaxID=60419 RepID=A0A8J4QBQ9_9ROSI|nr:hypothetical protein CMV_026497 [Castanea mollissima]